MQGQDEHAQGREATRTVRDPEELPGRCRVVIEAVDPEIGQGAFALKAVPGETVTVRADLFADGHDSLSAWLMHAREGDAEWSWTWMEPLVNDRWEGRFRVGGPGRHYYCVAGAVNHFATWRKDLQAKRRAGSEDPETELKAGLGLIEEGHRLAEGPDRELIAFWMERIRGEEDSEQSLRICLSPELLELISRYPDPGAVSRTERSLPVQVDRKLAGFSAWYELFPRSCTDDPASHGTFANCEKLLPDIASMGFDVVYLPPVHPIGATDRKGPDNTPRAGPDDPGSPWAIGNAEGGHRAVHSELGGLEGLQRFIARTRELDMEVALDLAFQCSKDHPYIAEHPDWFHWRPDGSIQFAENPPKKYEDVVPLNFETPDWPSLWRELRDVVRYWIEQGVRIFRVDNPHTKPFSFWEWLISQIKAEYPEVIFLAEAFTRPKVMYRLAKLGFTQSYTYFTWRNSKQELTEYMRELTTSPVRHFFRPNFWPNTPDILPEFLQHGGRPAFIIRLVLAATLSSNYGIYGPAFEVCENRAVPCREEYKDSEKYEILAWDRKQPGNLRDLVARVNRVRRENPALQRTENIRFAETDSEYVLAYLKWDRGQENILLITVNLDPFHERETSLRLPLEELGLSPEKPYLLHDLLGDEKYVWTGEWNRIGLNPHLLPARILRLHIRMRREQDFDYFM